MYSRCSHAGILLSLSPKMRLHRRYAFEYRHVLLPPRNGFCAVRQIKSVPKAESPPPLPRKSAARTAVPLASISPNILSKVFENAARVIAADSRRFFGENEATRKKQS